MVQTGTPTSTNIADWTVTGSASSHAALASVGDSSLIETATVTDVCNVSIATLSDPVIGTGHVIRFRAQATGSGGGEKVKVAIFNSTTERARSGKLTITRGSFADYSFTLSEAQANALDSYSNIRLEVVADTVGGSELLEVSYLALEVPNAAESKGQISWAEFEVPAVSGTLFERAATQTITISQSLARVQGHIRAIAQSIVHSSSILREGSTFQRTAVQTLTEADTVAIVSGKQRTATQTLTHSESILRQFSTFARTVSQSLIHSSIIARIQGHVRTASQSLTESDSVATQKGFARTVAQAITESDSVVRIQSHIRTFAQNLIHSESILRQGSTFIRAVSQSITHSELITSVKGLVRSVTQSLTHSESILREGSTFARTAVQSLIHSSSITTIQSHIRAISQSITESDSVVTVREFLRTVSQSLTHSESIARIQGHIRTATQSIIHSSVVVVVKTGGSLPATVKRVKRVIARGFNRG